MFSGFGPSASPKMPFLKDLHWSPRFFPEKPWKVPENWGSQSKFQRTCLRTIFRRWRSLRNESFSSDFAWGQSNSTSEEGFPWRILPFLKKAIFMEHKNAFRRTAQQESIVDAESRLTRLFRCLLCIFGGYNNWLCRRVRRIRMCNILKEKSYCIYILAIMNMIAEVWIPRESVTFSRGPRWRDAEDDRPENRSNLQT